MKIRFVTRVADSRHASRQKKPIEMMDIAEILCGRKPKIAVPFN